MELDQYDPDRDITPRFLGIVNGWFDTTPELFVVLRYLRAAGAKDYALFTIPTNWIV